MIVQLYPSRDEDVRWEMKDCFHNPSSTTTYEYICICVEVDEFLVSFGEWEL